MSSHEWVRIAGDGVELEGVLVPAVDARGAAVLCHPHPLYGGDMHNPVVRSIEAGMQQTGLTTLRFNFRGTGESTGIHDHGRGECEDLAAAIDFLRTRGGFDSVFAAGYSFGAMIALSEAEHVRATVAVAPPLAMMPLSNVPPRMPQLLVVGDRDPYCEVHTAERAVAEHPGLRRLHVVAGADHFFLAEGTAIREIVGRFVEPLL